MNQKKRELEQNELADALGQQIEKIKPHLPKIGMIAGVVLLFVVVTGFWISTRRGAIAHQWREFFFSSNEAELGDPRGLERVANEFPDTTAGLLALVQSGDYNYLTGTQDVIQNRDNYVNKLEFAADQYKRAVDSQANVDPFVRRRAIYGLAYTLESLGRFDEARDYYRMIEEQGGDSALAKRASEAIRRLDDANLVAIYSSFEDWQPSSIAPGPVLPTRPNIDFPGLSSAADDPPPSLGDSTAPLEGPETDPSKSGEKAADAGAETTKPGSDDDAKQDQTKKSSGDQSDPSKMDDSEDKKGKSGGQ